MNARPASLQNPLGLSIAECVMFAMRNSIIIAFGSITVWVLITTDGLSFSFLVMPLFAPMEE